MQFDDFASLVSSNAIITPVMSLPGQCLLQKAVAKAYMYVNYIVATPIIQAVITA